MWTQRFLPSSTLRVTTLKADAARLGPGWIAETHGRGFLVVHANRGGAVGPLFRTRTADPSAAVVNDDTGPVDIGILPLVRKPLSSNPFVCIGRLDGNDVCLPDDTVSKLHAIVREEGGVFTILDARSKNGTWVDGALVPARGEEPIVLKRGQVVRFGSITTTFLDAVALHEMCLQYL